MHREMHKSWADASERKELRECMMANSYTWKLCLGARTLPRPLQTERARLDIRYFELSWSILKCAFLKCFQFSFI